MRSLASRALRALARILGFPPGTGELVDGPTRLRLMLSFLGSLALAALELLGVLATLPLMQYVANVDRTTGALGRLSDLLGRPTDQHLLAAIAGLIVGTILVKDLVSIFFRRWQLHFMADQEVVMSTKVLRGYLDGPYRWSLEKTTGDKVFTIEGCVSIGYAAGLSSALAVLTEVVTITIIVVGLLFVSPLVTLACCVYFGLGTLGLQRFVRPRLIASGQRATDAGMASSSASLQALGAAKEIKLRHAQERFVASYRRSRWLGAHTRAGSAVLTTIPNYLLELMFVSAIGGIALFTAAIADPTQSLVLLGVFVAAGTRIVPSAVRLLAAFSGIKFARAPLAHLVDTVRYQRQEIAREAAEVRTNEIPTGDIEVRDLRFTYQELSPGMDPVSGVAYVLDGVDLDMTAGTSVALVGTSGAGKTTLVDVLLGLHKPNSGTITASGINVRDNLPAWQAQLAVVPQEVNLLDDSLAVNIAFEQDIDDERLWEAIDRAQLTDLVTSLPDGVNSSVGERGARLSGGQRQRIGIARALYRQPRYLFLDEATSALDNETERRLTETITSLKGSVTMVIVAHRLSTVRHCDQLIFMSAGRVAASGTFDEVAAANEEFANLVRLGSLVGEDAPVGHGA